MIIKVLIALNLLLFASSNGYAGQASSAPLSMRFLYPSLSGTFAAAWIAKEAGYFAAENLDVELIRVGGSTRIVASMVGGSAPIIHAGASASMAATVAGSDSVIIGCMSIKSPFHLIARPEIKQPSDLKGKRAGISAFGATSDFLVRLALRRFGLEPGKDVAILPTGGESEAFAALQAGSVQVAALAYPAYIHAMKMDMKELVNFSELGFEAVNAALVSTRSYLASNRDQSTRFVRALIRGMHRYASDKEFSKKVLSKYFRTTDNEILEASWKDVAPHLLKVPRPSAKAIQFIIDGQFKDKTPPLKAEIFVDTSIVDQLERSGFIDSVYR
ncbi:MAG: ABC transporter substrate-binding protein [Candidatus Binatia bacterium]